MEVLGPSDRMYPGPYPHTAINADTVVGAGEQGWLPIPAVDVKQNARFYRAPWAVPAPLDEKRRNFVDLPVPEAEPDIVWVSIRLDQYSTTVKQCEDRDGTPRRDMLQELGLEESYDEFKRGIPRDQVNTPLSRLNLTETGLDRLVKHGIKDVERLATTAPAVLEDLFGVDIARRLRSLANTVLSQEKADELANRRLRDHDALAEANALKDEQIKDLNKQVQELMAGYHANVKNMGALVEQAVQRALQARGAAESSVKSDGEAAGAALAQALEGAPRPGQMEGSVPPAAPPDPEPEPVA